MHDHSAHRELLEEWLANHNLTHLEEEEVWSHPAVVGQPGSGTVGAVALDSLGRLAAATSTGGITGKLPGRVGDSPLLGQVEGKKDDIF